MKSIDPFILTLSEFKSLLVRGSMNVLSAYFQSWQEIERYYGEEMWTYFSGINPALQMHPTSLMDHLSHTDRDLDSAFDRLICAGYSGEDDLILSIGGRLFRLKYKDYRSFVGQVYPDTFQMDFYQPEDFFVINYSRQKMFAMHHSGYWYTYTEA